MILTCAVHSEQPFYKGIFFQFLPIFKLSPPLCTFFTAPHTRLLFMKILPKYPRSSSYKKMSTYFKLPGFVINPTSVLELFLSDRGADCAVQRGVTGGRLRPPLRGVPCPVHAGEVTSLSNHDLRGERKSLKGYLKFQKFTYVVYHYYLT